MPTQIPPTFEDFVQFIRRGTARRKKPITAEILIEENLGVTGDDGIDLLEAVEKEYGISLEPIGNMLQLKPNEQLFHDEGIGLFDFQALRRWFNNEPKLTIRDLRVGELYDVVCRLIVVKGETYQGA